MLSDKFIRLGIVLSALWIVAGGWWSYARNSYYHNLGVRLAREACEGRSPEDLLCSMEVDNILPVEWGSFAIEVVGGLVVIWLAVLALRWILSPKI
ncbi:MAG: hypothetical protein J7530_01295 [Novosphingobium sp.]|nr:hypothetical protein [Novosphingobium sp.]